jgi:GTP-binding protein Era
MIIDIKKFSKEEYENVFEFLSNQKQPIFVALNKIYEVRKEIVLETIDSLKDNKEIKEIIPLSALKKTNIKHLIDFFISNAKPGPWMYEDDEISDQTDKKLAEEITRKHTYLQLHQELPYSLKVETEQWQENDQKIVINQAIFVTKNAHKSIVLGKGGEKIKAIGKGSRHDLQKLFDKRIELYLFVKVREDWIDRDFGQYV